MALHGTKKVVSFSGTNTVKTLFATESVEMFVPVLAEKLEPINKK
jgi:predicted glycosyltransferase